VLEPLYVTAGFSLYLSRRTVLEGWDLEVAFKRLTARVATGGMKQAAVLLLTAMVLQGAAGNDAWAQAAADPPAQAVPDAARSEPAPVSVSAEKKMIEEILSGPDFTQYEDRKVWRRKNPLDKKKPDFKIGDGWLAFAQFLAEALRVVAWVVAIAFVGWLLYYLAQRLGWFKELIGKRTLYKPDVLFGMDLRAESLPADIPAAARALLAQGDMRAALSLLYRGALRVLIHERELDVREGDTEGDCVRRVNHTAPGALAEYFRRLVEAWGLIAYARRSPEPTLAQGLVEDWARYFVPQRERVPA
jgi:hypothetical protein